MKDEELKELLRDLTPRQFEAIEEVLLSNLDQANSQLSLDWAANHGSIAYVAGSVFVITQILQSFRDLRKG